MTKPALSLHYIFSLVAVVELLSACLPERKEGGTIGEGGGLNAEGDTFEEIIFCQGKLVLYSWLVGQVDCWLTDQLAG